MMKKKNFSLLIFLSLLLVLPLGLWGQANPITLVVEKKEKVELAYDLEQICKLTFDAGQLHFYHLDNGKQFLPHAIDLDLIAKLYFASDKSPNNNEEILPYMASTLCYSVHEGLLRVEGFKEEKTMLSLYTSDGRLAWRGEVSAPSCTMDVSAWEAGIYLLTTSHSQTLKIILP